jgi:hypothetical protein
MGFDMIEQSKHNESPPAPLVDAPPLTPEQEQQI